ncbi:MAG: T9SS type A sorting domain-containing protein, partial [candidate division WOR-3 bacterium]
GWGWYIDDVRITGVKNSSGIIRDVGPISIDFPYSNVLPNITIHPKARCRNFGWQSESVLVFMRIDSLNITVYLQDTIVVIEPYTETTITFETWTTGGSGGIIYDIYTFTQLDGDQYPFNDTLHQHTVTSFSFWESLPAPFPLPSSGHSLASYDNGTYMVFGIHTPGNYLDTTLIYNISADIWIGGPKNPFGSASYGTVNVVNGRFYRIGGTCNFPNPLDRVDIYDPASNLWISGSPAPTGLIDHTSGIYKDSLIYILGNGNWSYPTSNLVYIYDTYTDNWITANPFPGPGRGACAGGIIDSFIIIACGFRDGGEFCNDYILGVINKSNPAFITWGQWQVIPGMDSGRCRIPYTIDILNKELWLVGGKLANNQETGEVWSYNPYTNIWTNWQLPKPHPVCNVAPVVITTTCYGNRGIFVPSGYHANQYIGEHELFHVWNQSVAEEEKGNLYSNFAYLRCLPNPVNKMCMIRYNTRCTQDIEIKIYDVAGRLVKKLVDRRLEPQGEKLIYWDVCDERGKPVPSGVYFVHLNSAEYTLIDKTTILRCGRYGSR